MNVFRLAGSVTLAAAVCIGCCVLGQGCASPEPTAEREYVPEAASTDVNAEVEGLKAENQFLGQQLRKMANATNATPATSAASVSASVPNETGYWLTITSSKRHNSKCRYYKMTEGRPCESTNGVPCKLCGG